MSIKLKIPAKGDVSASSSSTIIRLPGKWLGAARVVWIVLLIIGIGFLITSLPGYWLRIKGNIPGDTFVDLPSLRRISSALGGIFSLAAVFLSLGLSVFLFRKRFENPAVMAISFHLLLYGIIMAGVLETWSSYWIENADFIYSLQGFLLGTPTIALFALFPNGRIEPHWMRGVLLASLPLNLIYFLISPSVYLTTGFSIYLLFFVIWLVLLPGLGIYAQIYRYKNVSTPDERLQTRWMLFGFGLWSSFIVISTLPYLYLSYLPPDAAIPWWGLLVEVGWWLSLFILPISLTIAITRYKLWDVNFVINRTLVYGGLTVLTMGFYIFIVGYLGNLLQAIDQSFIAFLATGLVAVLFQPLKDWIQRGVNRVMFGQRDDPVAVISELGGILEQAGSPEVALKSIVETVARTLKLPYSAILLGNSTTSYGIQATDVHKIPLKYQNESIGYLVVGQRSQGEAFSSADIQLLENVAHQAGAAAHAVKLTADLRQSRLELIKMREEERRRIRRDLHDGLGPTLASLNLKLDAVRNFLRKSPQEAEALIDELKIQTAETIHDVRRLVYDLRPPTLDEFGLAGAIENFVETNNPGELEIKLEIPDSLPPLNAALEVAIFRTVQEGITNIIHHAKSESARIRISNQNLDIVVDIIDDGVGLPADMIPGIGLFSIQERADELDGTFSIQPASRGLHLRVSFPLLLEENS
jgi:signal transduction histidine kinase